MLPPDYSTETAYWDEVALKVKHLLDDADDDFPSQLASMVLEAVELCDPTSIDASGLLYLSNMSVADSRLAMARLGLKVSPVPKQRARERT